MKNYLYTTRTILSDRVCDENALNLAIYLDSWSDYCAMKASVVRLCDRIARMTSWSDDGTCANVIGRAGFVRSCVSSNEFSCKSEGLYTCLVRFLRFSAEKAVKMIPSKKIKKEQRKSRSIAAWNIYLYTVYTRIIRPRFFQLISLLF